MTKVDTTSNSATTHDKPKRRWLNIGPGIILALAASAFIASGWVKTEMATRRQHSAPPIIERQVISSAYEEKSGPTPEIKFIIDRSGKIGLTDAQLSKLRVLQSQWHTYYDPKIAQANQAAEKTREYLNDAKGRSRTPIPQIQSEAGGLIALSAEISTARRSYWSRAVNVLTPIQRDIVQSEREADWAARIRATSTRR